MIPKNSNHQNALQLYGERQYDKAIAVVDAMIAGSPYDPDYWALLGHCLLANNDIDRAFHAGSRVLKLSPNNPDGFSICGMSLASAGHFEDALNYLNKSDQLLPGRQTVLWNRGICNLASGNWIQGWSDYENGFNVGLRTLRYHRNEWDGSPMPGKTLIVWTEQGLGDCIQFARFLIEAKERSQAIIVLEARAETMDLLSPLVDAVVTPQPDGPTLVPFDKHVPLLSLPYIMGLGDPVRDPYIADPGIPVDTQGAKVGFCWRGSKTHANDHNRSLTIEQAKSFEGFASFGNLTLGDSPFEMPELCSLDMTVTASAIAKLDLVITVDSCIAHLSAAMGIETWVIAPINSEYRHGVASYGKSSPWYPTVRTYRSDFVSFDSALEEIKHDLKERYAR